LPTMFVAQLFAKNYDFAKLYERMAEEAKI
jgi:hypothetical protein